MREVFAKRPVRTSGGADIAVLSGGLARDARRVDLRAAFLLLACVALAIELTHGLGTRPDATNRDRGSRFVIALCIAPGAILVALAPTIVPSASIGPVGVRFGIGGALLLIGCGLRLWAMRTLGRYFTREVMVSSDQRVVTSGPYRIVRHPSYTALLLYAIGAGVAAGNWVGLAAITLLALVALVNRIQVEEDALLSVLGDSYRIYAESHPRLIPLVW